MSSVSTTNISGTDNDFDRPSGTGASLHRYPGTSCLATISLSLRDKSHSPIEAPAPYLRAIQPWAMLSWPLRATEWKRQTPSGCVTLKTCAGRKVTRELTRKPRLRSVRSAALRSWHAAARKEPGTSAGGRGFDYPEDDAQQLCATDYRKAVSQTPSGKESRISAF